VGGNRVELLTDGKTAFSEMEEMIAGAKREIHLLFYAWHTDETGRRFRDLLVEKARHGVKVRLLCDALGSGGATGRFLRPLREAGGKVALFSPTRYLRRSLAINFRNHRKILVVDGAVAYTGGFNIGDDYAWKWRDAGLLLRGPVVAQLQEIFAEDWYFSTRESLAASCRKVREGDGGEGDGAHGDAVCAMVAGGPDTENNVTQDAFFLTVSSAQERVWITTPYLIPTASIQTVLRAAVHRGVDVRVLIPRTSDQWFTAMAGRSYYPSLLSSGVKLFEFEPAMMHAKVWVVDREISVVGSANLDTRSFKLNFETSCFVKSAEVNALLAGLFQAQLLESREVTAESLRRRGYWTDLAEAAMNLFSPLL
jgi:cardiolipin synthase